VGKGSSVEAGTLPLGDKDIGLMAGREPTHGLSSLLEEGVGASRANERARADPGGLVPEVHPPA
jgi:hypothetical protein